MKKILLSLILVFGFSFCEGQRCLWARQTKGIGFGNAAQGIAVATDSVGNVFETGCYEDTLIFGNDTLFGTHFLGNYIYLVKYDSSGNLLWVNSSTWENTAQTPVISVNADNKGNSYITGYYDNTVSFGSDTLFLSHTYNVFYVKYDPSGNVLWAKNAIPASSNCNISGHCGCPDNKGNSYLTGTFYDTVTFGSYTLYSIHSPTCFLVKYDMNGNVLWAKNAVLTTSSSSVYPYSVSTDKMGNAYVAGYFNDTVSFGTHKLYSGSNYSGCFGMFLAKYDTSGNVIWATCASTASSTSSIYGTAVSTDENGNSYITGYYQDTIYFGTHTISTPFISLENMFLVKYDSSGNFKWVMTPTAKNSKSQSNGHAVSIDNKGNVYVSGHIDDTVAIGIDTLIEIHSVWYAPTFVAKYDSSGNLICAEGFENGQEGAISADRYGNFYFGGTFDGYLILDKDSLDGSSESSFLSKWKPCADTNITTLVTPITNIPSLSLFPNPNTGAFTLEVKSEESRVLGTKSVEIYNVMGQKVFAEILRSAQDDNRIELPNQPNGVYFYRVIDEAGKLLGEGKFVIEK